jgi:hypothetical protein
MFQRLPEQSDAGLRVLIDGVSYANRHGDTVAAALLLAGRAAFRRSALSAQLRGPYCLMGACFECLVRIDGMDGQQACLIEVRDGMRVETGTGERKEGA